MRCCTPLLRTHTHALKAAFIEAVCVLKCELIISGTALTLRWNLCWSWHWAGIYCSSQAQVHSAVASRQPEDRLGRMGVKSFLQQQPVRPFPLALGRGFQRKGSVRT